MEKKKKKEKEKTHPIINIPKPSIPSRTAMLRLKFLAFHLRLARACAWFLLVAFYLPLMLQSSFEAAKFLPRIYSLPCYTNHYKRLECFTRINDSKPVSIYSYLYNIGTWKRP